MPPQGLPRPDPATYDALAAWLETTLDRAALAQPNPGRPLVHRLNRAEYANAIRDLLALDVDAATLLPPDDSSDGFDNIADVLGVSPALLERYLSAAGKISALAVGRPGDRPELADLSRARRRVADRARRRPAARHPRRPARASHVPARRRVRHQGQAAADEPRRRSGASSIRNSSRSSIDGERVHLAPVGGDGGLRRPSPENATDVANALDARLQARVPVKAGPRDVGGDVPAEVVGAARHRPAVVPAQHAHRDRSHGPAARRELHRSPARSTRPAPATRRAGGASSPVVPLPRADEKRLRARRIVATLARRALPAPGHRRRRCDRLLGVLRRRARQRGHVRAPASSSRCEPSWRARSSCSASSAIRPVSRPARRTASATSSWRRGCRSSSGAASPTTSCSALAAKRPAAGAGRPRAAGAPDAGGSAGRSAREQLRRPVAVAAQPARRRRPTRTSSRISTTTCGRRFQRETELFFGSIMREDRNVARAADRRLHVRERAAGEALRHPGRLRQPVPPRARDRRSAEGLLGQGSILIVTSHADRTSPVVRGKWILDNLLGTPPPPPPPDVPPLKENAGRRQAAVAARADGGAPREPGVRQLPQGHGSDRASRSRTSTRSARGGPRTTATPIDASGQLADGTPVDGVVSLREALLKRPETFVGDDDREAADLRAGPRRSTYVRHAGGPRDRARARPAGLPVLVARARASSTACRFRCGRKRHWRAALSGPPRQEAGN